MKRIFISGIFFVFCSMLSAQEVKDVYSLAKDGVKKFWRGDYKEAIEIFDKAIATDKEKTKTVDTETETGTDALLYYWRGISKYWLAYHYSGDYKDAIEDFDKVVRHQPDYAPAYLYRGDAKLHWGDPDSAWGKNSRGAQADFDKAVELDPSYCKKAAKIEIPKDAPKTKIEQELRKILSEEELLAEKYLLHGNTVVYHILTASDEETFKDAIADFDKAIKLNPNYIDAYISRGIAKTNLEDYKGTRDDFDKAISINPSLADAIDFEGHTYAMKNGEKDTEHKPSSRPKSK